MRLIRAATGAGAASLRGGAALALVAGAFGGLSTALHGGALRQSHTPEPAAQRAFEALVKTTRERAPYSAQTSLVVRASEGEHSADAPPLEAKLFFDPRSTPRRAVLELRGFTVRVHEGRIDVTHASNERDYVSIEDDGSPYYTLLLSFVDLPYPQIGLVLGDDDLGDLLTQLTSRAGWIVPTKVEEVERPVNRRTSGAADDGAAPRLAPADESSPAVPDRPTDLTRRAQRIHFTSDFEHLEIDVDPLSQAILGSRLKLTGGPMVAQGATLQVEIDCEESPLPPEDVAARFAFDPGARRRIDSIAALARVQEQQGGERRGVVAANPGMVGRRAPDVSMERWDEGDFDLSNFRGRRVVVLDFWATWCGPCRVGLPKLDAVARRLAAKGVPLEVAAVNTMEGLEGEALRRRVDGFWRDRNFSLSLVLDEKGEAADAFGVRGLPTTVVIGSDGVVHWYQVGLSERWEEELEAVIERAQRPFGAPVAPDADDDGT